MFSFDFAKHTQPYDHIIWDWNGTLLNDVELCFSVLTELLAEHQLPVPAMDEYRAAFRFPVQDYYADFGFDFEKVSFDALSQRFMQLYGGRVRSAKLFHGALDWLAAVKSSHKEQSILSAASQVHLNEILVFFDIMHHFDRVYGIANDHAVSKLQRGRELLLEARSTPAKTLLIGDTDHDLEVGKALGVDVLLIADGHQHGERLKSLHDNVIVSRFGSRSIS